MSLSPKGLRRLADALRGTEVPNWPSLTTRQTNRMEAGLRLQRGFHVWVGTRAPAARRSPARMQEAVNWRIARAEARKIIERMGQS